MPVGQVMRRNALPVQADQSLEHVREALGEANTNVAAVYDGAARVGDAVGLPLHHYPLDRAADAHAAVQDGAVGKVLIDVADER